MKKIAILFIAVFCLSGTYAQKSIRFGLKGSPVLAYMKPEVSLTESEILKNMPSFDDASKYVSEGIVVGFSYGIIVDLAISNNYWFSSGLSISYNGGKLSYPSVKEIADSITTNVLLERKFSLQYIEIPLLLKMKTNEIGMITYFGQFGFGTSFLIDAVALDKYDVAGDNITNEDIDIQNTVSFFRESLIVGAGIEYSLSDNLSVIAGLNFNNGFTDILSKSNEIDQNIKEKSISNYFEVNVGILF